MDSGKKSNIIVDFVLAFPLIFVNAFKGLKYIFFDMWKKNITVKSSEAEDSVTNLNTQENEQENALYSRTEEKTKEDIEYEKMKLSHAAKKKTYHYSKATMAKYEKMKQALETDLQAAGATRTKEAHIYQYIVKKENGKIVKDTMRGFSKLDINAFLVNEGDEVYDIRTSKTIDFLYNDTSIFGGKMKVKDLVFWLTQLATYLRAGITLNESVRILTLQMNKKKNIAKILRAVYYELQLGESFSNALDKQGNYFPALLINMIRAAEASGTLQETLDEMADYYTDVSNTRKEMKSALTYPAIITIFAVAVVTFIIVYVVPQFTKIYAESDIEITGITAIIIKISDFLSNNLITVILVFVVVIISLFFAYKKIKGFKVFVQVLSMKTPVIKNVIIYKEINIFAKTFASLLKNNVFITDSMEILSKITENEIYKGIMHRTVSNIVKGDKISEAFADHWAVPDVAYYMIVTGESTGQLADMMEKVGAYYQESHKSVVNSLKSLIEPIMIVFLAAMVGTIILAVIVPMFQMYNSIL